MNRILKKAISFFSAVAIGISTLAAGAVTAQAASSVSIKQTISNKYEMAIGMSDSALFVSKVSKKDGGYAIPKNAEMVMVNNRGKKVKLKNTAGFDKIYYTGTMYMSYSAANTFETSSGLVFLKKGSKYAALLQNGTYLAEGKLFDRIEYSGLAGVTAVTGKTHYFYDFDGKLVCKYQSSKKLVTRGYDKSTKTVIAAGVDNDGDGKVNFYLIKNNKIIKTIKNCFGFNTTITTAKKKTYLVSNGENGSAIYSMSGKKVAKITPDKKNTTTETPQCNVKMKIDFDNDIIFLMNRENDNILKTYYCGDDWRYKYLSSIHTLQNGKSFFISRSEDCTKYGCITF